MAEVGIGMTPILIGLTFPGIGGAMDVARGEDFVVGVSDPGG
jgi:hypothetical protein